MNCSGIGSQRQPDLTADTIAQLDRLTLGRKFDMTTEPETRIEQKTKLPLLAVLTLALLVGNVWGVVSLLWGNFECQTSSQHSEAATGHPDRLRDERTDP